MSHVMLEAVIRMPYKMAMHSEISRRQFYSRANQALDEMEAYANARVREALEEAAKILDNESERYEQKAQEIMHDEPDEVPNMRSTAWRLSVCARKIRALIPTTT